MASILIIDDEATFATLLGGYLQQQGHSVLGAASGEEGGVCGIDATRELLLDSCGGRERVSGGFRPETLICEA